MNLEDPVPAAAKARTELVDAVLRSIQHDMRNAAQLLSGTVGDPDLPEGFHRLVSRVLSTLDEQMARIDWCRRPSAVELGPVDLQGAIRSALDALGLGKPSQHFQLEIEVPSELPAIVARDAMLSDTFACFLLAIRGPSGVLPRRRAVHVAIARDGLGVTVTASADHAASESEAERDQRDAGFARTIDMALLAGASHATVDSSGVRLRFPVWQRHATSEAQPS